MIHTIFYGLVFFYYYRFFMTENFSILGNEFVALVITGFIANLQKRQG